MQDISGYEKLKENARKYYGEIRLVYSPVFDCDVCFSAEGFNHIVFKNKHGERERSSQILRFKLLSLAVKLVSLTTTFQEFEETLKEFPIKRFKKKSKKTMPVRYWGIIAIIDGRKIKVIIRQIGNSGQIHFWSIVPAWTTNKFRDVKFISTMKGDPIED
ncbi:MAG: hypothetical protein WCO55_01565 [Candidatus Falkowbacteria bacterium]